ncbi:PHA/PHB synthase family protein [Pseudonocardia lutea]|uniref:PHA/PHB synthase family protein n=1 Tax=Pseudonocardia lutea TaxID=2172015 RepID=A0ABW1ICL0_9PSEU
MSGTDPVPIPAAVDLVRGAARTLLQGRSTVREAVRLAKAGVELVRGPVTVRPDPRDRRFADPAWALSPIYSRVASLYLQTCRSLDLLLEDLEAARGTDESARFVVQAAEALLAPTNQLWGNPAALKHAFDTAGASLVRGARNALDDLQHNGGMPSTVDRTALAVGRDMAVTPGWVVRRDEMAELIAYTPTTAEVRERPLLVVPPPIGRYYFLDLRPGRSFVEYAVLQGVSTHLLSWRNPQKHQSGWGIDDYAAQILTAVDAVRQATGSPDVNVVGFCAGGLLTATVLNHLAALGDERIHSATLAVTLLDFDAPAPIEAFSAPRLLALARSRSDRAGVIDARSMAAVFAWMRPNDLIFNYVVANWLRGERPPVFDILAWNADGTNLPAALHRTFLDCFEDNLMCEPGALTVLGTPVDLSRITVPTYVTGAINDHLTPWRGTYRTTQLLSGPSTYVLSNAGHIQALVNPPGNPKATYTTDGATDSDPDVWAKAAHTRRGSWWEHWARWLLERSGAEVPALDPRLRPGFAPLDPAPGRYVHDRGPAAAPGGKH